MGGLALAASHDSHEYTKAGRAAFRDSFVDQVDPDRLLPEPERERRAEAARRLHYTKLALKSAQVRAARKARKGAAQATSAAPPEQDQH